MNRAPDFGVDWRDSEAYACLLEADRSFFAWEWLRRDPSYRAAAALVPFSAEQGFDERAARSFGLVRFESPEARVPDARPMWRAELDPRVLVAEGEVLRTARRKLKLDTVSHLATFVSGERTDHLLLSDGLRSVRVDAPRGGMTAKAMRLHLPFEPFVSGELSLLALRQFVALVRFGRFARSLHPPETRARRWILQLRTHDALVSGADLRQIAQELLGRPTAGPRWRSRDPSLRSQAQRMVRSARAMAAGGFRDIIGAQSKLHFRDSPGDAPAVIGKCPRMGLGDNRVPHNAKAGERAH